MRSFGGRYLYVRIVGAAVAVMLIVGSLSASAKLSFAGVPGNVNSDAYVYVYPYPRDLVRPRISGVTQEFQQLTVRSGLWLHMPTTITDQWLRCRTLSRGSCTAIPGAVRDILELTAGDVGDRIRVEETAVNSHGSGAPAYSPPTRTVTSVSGS